MIGTDPGLQQAAAMAIAEAERKKKQEEGGTGLSDVLDGVGGAVDAGDLAITACKAAANAMKPNFTTGGLDRPAGFGTGGGDGLANAFETAADCAPAAEGATSLLDIAASAGETVVDGIGSVLGGLLDGL